MFSCFQMLLLKLWSEVQFVIQIIFALQITHYKQMYHLNKN